MYDKERIGKILSDIERYFSDLESLNIRKQEDLNDKKLFYSASMLLFSLINRSIDLGEEILTAKNIGTPSTYKEIFFLLSKGKVISNTLKNQLSELSSYRNMFSHEYFDFTESEVFRVFKNIHFIKDFVKSIKKIL